MSNGRAKRGGEVGLNGEDCKGGQFLPSTEMPKQHKPTVKRTGKQEIAPFVWEVSLDGKRSLFSRWSGVWAWDVVGVSFKVADGLNVDYFGSEFLANAAQAAAKWNAGERWID